MSQEFDFIRWIRKQQSSTPLVRTGIGDDLAILNWPAGDLLLVGVDQLLDGVHVDSAIQLPRAIGKKAMNRNLSDCAAMGCLPAAALVSVALPKGIGEEYAKEIYLGIKDAGDLFSCPIVGGDTASWAGKLLVTVSILGKSDGVPPITRGGAKPGDRIYVTGPLGGSLLGRHMTFQPRVALGRALASSRIATSMIDLSDGLSRDLKHICDESGVGANLNATSIPIHVDATEMSKTDRRSPLEHALDDGEDYELLFTSQSPVTDPAYHQIGIIAAEPGIWLRSADGTTQPLVPQSWQHQF